MELSRAERERILNKEIHALTRRGYQLQHSTGTAAQLVLPKPPSTFAPSCLLVIATLGLWLVIEFLKILVQPIKKEHSLYVEVLPNGTIEKTTDGWIGGTSRDMRHVTGEDVASTDYSSAAFVLMGFSGDLWMLEDRLELWKGGGLHGTLKRQDVSKFKASKPSFTPIAIYGPGGELFAKTYVASRKDVKKVRKYFS